MCVYIPGSEGKKAMLRPDLVSIILGQDAVGRIGGPRHADKGAVHVSWAPSTSQYVVPVLGACHPSICQMVYITCECSQVVVGESPATRNP